jgi:hypothetical protein
MLTWEHGVFAPNAPLRPLVTEPAHQHEDLDQSPEFVAAEPQPIPGDDFDQSRRT